MALDTYGMNFTKINEMSTTVVPQPPGNFLDLRPTGYGTFVTGWGTTVSSALYPSGQVTSAQANQLFQQDYGYAQSNVLNLTQGVSLTPQQLAGLTDLAYWRGPNSPALRNTCAALRNKDLNGAVNYLKSISCGYNSGAASRFQRDSVLLNNSGSVSPATGAYVA